MSSRSIWHALCLSSPGLCPGIASRNVSWHPLKQWQGICQQLNSKGLLWASAWLYILAFTHWLARMQQVTKPKYFILSQTQERWQGKRDLQHGSRHTVWWSFMPLSQTVLLSITDGPRQKRVNLHPFWVYKGIWQMSSKEPSWCDLRCYLSPAVCPVPLPEVTAPTAGKAEETCACTLNALAQAGVLA